jgi:S-adenosylmethionine hydrolase
MPFLVVMKDEYTFIGPDNGIFGLLWDGESPDKVFRLRLTAEELLSTLPMKDLYVRAVKHLVNGGELRSIGEKVSEFRLSAMGRPAVSENFIRTSIIYFDRFENAVVNLRKDEFEQLRKGRRFIIYFKRYDDIESISDSYFSVMESEKLCLFNSTGYLEIAINKGKAMGLLNLNLGDIVQIEFK